MNYLYLIQKKENLGTNLYKIGLLKTKEKINKNHKICLLLNNYNKLINLSNLSNDLSNKFLKHEKNNYFIGNENDLIMCILGYYKSLLVEKLNKTIENNKFDLVKNICLLKLKDNDRYNSIVKLCDQKVELRNIIFDSTLGDDEKYRIINNMVRMKSLNNFGKENYNYIENYDLSEIIKSNSFIKILDEYLNLVHFNDICPENNNIVKSNNNLKIYENNKWVNNDNNIQKILDNTLNNVYYLIFCLTMENNSDDLFYTKGLLTLKKINKLIELS